MATRRSLLFVLLAVLLAVLFWADLALGSVHIPPGEVVSTLAGRGTDAVHEEILLNLRLPGPLPPCSPGPRWP